jgi:hypothetical protein
VLGDHDGSPSGSSNVTTAPSPGGACSNHILYRADPGRCDDAPGA